MGLDLPVDYYTEAIKQSCIRREGRKNAMTTTVQSSESKANTVKLGEVEEKTEQMLRQARLAAAVFTQYTQEQVDKIVKAMTIAAIEAAPALAQQAHEETRMGLTEDKVLKNFVASEFQYNQIKNTRTCGIVKEYPEEDMVEYAEPIGVILALSPVTNPTSTVIFKSIACAKTRNAIVFSAHLMAANCSNNAAQIVYEAGLKAGAPKHFITWVEKSSKLRKETERMMSHPQVDLIFATGGTQMVRTAYSSGKPALGVGSGNTPCYLHKSADIHSSVKDIITSKTFDNGTECPSEQTLVIDREVGDQVLREFERLGCYVCKPEEVNQVADAVIEPKTGGMNYKLVGQPAYKIAQEAGLDVPLNCKIILCPLEGELRHHRLAVEKLMPVLGYVFVDSIYEGINRSLDINYGGGTGHTAGVFAKDEDVIALFADSINAGRIIVNCPTSIGGLGGVYNNLNTTLSFGCGTGGGNITSDNVGIKNLINYKKVPRRTVYDVVFQTTNSLHVNPGSIDVLSHQKTKSAVILTTKSADKRGHLSAVLEKMPEDCKTRVYDNIGVEPDFSAVKAAVDFLRATKPDTIVALGGGSVLDAAKLIRLFYDYPDLDIEQLSVAFLDFRNRIAQFPKSNKTKLIAIPTTSGTGSEVTPFAVMRDNEKQRKISFVDQTLLPDIAIVDANFTKTLPLDITCDTAFDALTHALEALVSAVAFDYTDGLALESMRLIFEALPMILENPQDIVYRHKLHHGSCLAGMAIGNVSVGVNHALAHSLGATFDIAHGRANGVFLLSTLDYNENVPGKFVSISNYHTWVADKKYARAAEFLGLYKPEEGKADTDVEVRKGIKALKQRIYDIGRLCKQPLSISELGIKPEEFQNKLPILVKAAFEDLSIKTNPRFPMIEEMVQLFVSAYPERQPPSP